jgi:hypothetical protein
MAAEQGRIASAWRSNSPTVLQMIDTDVLENDSFHNATSCLLKPATSACTPFVSPKIAERP